MEIKKLKGKNNNKGKKIFLGIEFLRMILSFLIVYIHCFSRSNAKSKFYLIPFKILCFYVPTFFLISFYFSYKSFVLRDINKIVLRFKRFLIPYIIWPILIWIKNNYNYYFYKIKGKTALKNLYCQLLIGCGVHGVFWFHFNLIFVSLFLVINIFIFKKNYMFILYIICLIIYILNYFGYISKIFLKYNKIPVRHSIKPISNTLIYATTGFFLSSLNIINVINNNKKKSFLILFFLFFYVIKYYNKINTLYYSFDVIIIDIVGTFLFLFFSILPLEKINILFIQSIFRLITSYTGGIYYLHPEVMLMFKNIFKDIYYRTFKGCFLIYIISYFICFLGSKIFSKYSLKLLFI